MFVVPLFHSVRRATAPFSSMRGRCDHWHPRTRCDPIVVALELQTELAVSHSPIAITATRDGIRHDRLDLLGHDADIGLPAAVVDEAVEANPVLETTEISDVVLQSCV